MKMLFVVALFVSIWFGSVNIMKAIRGHAIPSANFFIMSIAFTAVITHFMGMW